MDINSLTNAIIDTYIAGFDLLNETKKKHFLYRAHLISDRTDVTDLLQSHVIPLIIKKVSIFDNLSEEFEKYVEKKRHILKDYVAKKINDEKKVEAWKHHMDIYCLSLILWILYYYQVFTVGTKNFVLSDTEKIVEELLWSDDYIMYATVSAVNLVFNLRNLSLIDTERDFIAKFRSIFTEEKITDTLIFHNYIYGLTHIIIGESNFYIQHIDKIKYSWILQEFLANSERIYNELSLDINVEVAICMKLFEQGQLPFVKNVEKRLWSNFNPEDKYIHREGMNNLIFAEHMNAIALLLLNFKKLKLK